MKVDLIAKSTSEMFFDREFTSDLICGQCAAISYGKVIEEDFDEHLGHIKHMQRIIEHCIKNGHESVLEHVSFTFLITGISRACSHQLVRHRIASFTQRSQRYVEEDEDNFIMPPSINTKDASELYFDVIDVCNEAYKKLRELGVKKEDARYLLPNAVCTDLYMTINGRSLRNFLKLRLDKKAQWEIRLLAGHIYDILEDDAPGLLLGINKEE